MTRKYKQFGRSLEMIYQCWSKREIDESKENSALNVHALTNTSAFIQHQHRLQLITIVSLEILVFYSHLWMFCSILLCVAFTFYPFIGHAFTLARIFHSFARQQQFTFNIHSERSVCLFRDINIIHINIFIFYFFFLRLPTNEWSEINSKNKTENKQPAKISLYWAEE